MIKYMIAIVLILIALLLTEVVKRFHKIEIRLHDLKQTVSCLEGGNKVEQKFNVGPDGYDRVCLLNGNPWISWRSF